MRSYSLALVATSLAFLLVAAPAQAQVARTFVSAAGSDGNNCANVATPCRHFQNAVNVTAPGGEVVALDPANYGSVTISHQITINGQGWAYVAPPIGGNAITVNASSTDAVTIHGVVLDGTGATGGTNGIVFNSGGSLTVTDCVAQNFLGSGTSGNGILIQATLGKVNFVITNTIVTNNSFDGINYSPPTGSPTASGIIDHVTATGNQFGIDLIPRGASQFTVSNVIVGNNLHQGIFVAGLATVSIDNANVFGNEEGIRAEGIPNLLLGRSVITGNSSGITNNINNTSPNTFFTYKDNRINENTADITGSTPALNAALNLQ